MEKHTHVFLSDEAWTGLQRLANHHLYVTKFVRALPNKPSAYRDNRPEWMRRDEEMLLAGRYPMWSDERPRVKHTLALKPEVRALLIRISEWFVITNHQRSDSFKRPTSCMSAVLEALGLGYLVIVNLEELQDDGEQG